MEQIVYTVAAHAGSKAAPLSSTEYLRLLEERLAWFEVLADSLVQCRAAFINSNFESIMQWVEKQALHCNEIKRVEQVLARYQSAERLRSLLSSSEMEKAHALLQRTVKVKNTVQQLNRVYDGLIRKASQNNTVLRNLYANAFVYTDPRSGLQNSGGRMER
jgi:hypothetical protein